MRRGMNDLPQNVYPDKRAKAGRHDAPKYNPPRAVVRRGKFASQLSNVGDNSSQPVLNSNDKRVYLLVQNNGTSDVFINFANKATQGNIKIIAGGNYEPSVAPIDSIYLVSETGMVNLCSIVEGVEKT